MNGCFNAKGLIGTEHKVAMLECTEELLQFWGVEKCLNCKAAPPGKVWRAISTRRQGEGAGACTTPSKYIQEFSDGWMHQSLPASYMQEMHS